jgi:hypothetical protein
MPAILSHKKNPISFALLVSIWVEKPEKNPQLMKTGRNR